MCWGSYRPKNEAGNLSEWLRGSLQLFICSYKKRPKIREELHKFQSGWDKTRHWFQFPPEPLWFFYMESRHSCRWSLLTENVSVWLTQLSLPWTRLTWGESGLLLTQGVDCLLCNSSGYQLTIRWAKKGVTPPHLLLSSHSLLFILLSPFVLTVLCFTKEGVCETGSG